MSVNEVASILAILTLVVAVPLNLLVVWRLWVLHVRAPKIKVLRERGIVATVVLWVLALFALIFVNNDIAPPPLDTGATKLITRAAILILGIVPALYWLWIYRDDD